MVYTTYYNDHAVMKHAAIEPPSPYALAQSPLGTPCRTNRTGVSHSLLLTTDMCERNRMHSTSGSPGEDHKARVAADVRLVQAIRDGSVDAWHDFVNTYSGLIYAIVRRHLPAEDEDEWRDVYVDVLKALYNGELEKYVGGPSRLAAWLTVFTRRRVFDIVRQRHGRYRRPKGYSSLREIDKLVLRLFYEQRLPIEISVQMLKWNGHRVTSDEVAESICRIEETMDRRYLNRLDRQHQAQEMRAAKVSVLRHLAWLTIEYEDGRVADLADAELMANETQAAAERVRAIAARLSTEERKVIFFRFNREWSARKISDKMQLGGQRKVYTIIERALRKLRNAIADDICKLD